MWVNAILHIVFEYILQIYAVDPSKTDTIGEITFVLYKEVSFIQGFLNYDIFVT